eukprot:GGOE01019866.1.p1 GENE.GGOE01019866.1~~GGOE01019866.1.p1  ORF type:complete len:561 (-),score=168.85 GGOE01019866.1:172-1812(-)
MAEVSGPTAAASSESDAPPATSSVMKEQEDESDNAEEPTVSHNTRFHHLLSSQAPTEQTLHIGFIVGKTQDPVVSAEWMQKACSDEGMWQSDEAVGQYVAQHYPHIRVTIFRPRLADIPRLIAKFAGCDVVHILESEQFLTQHNYKNYKQLFQVLDRFGTKLRPSLATMQFIMSKVDYISLLARHRIPHVPTFILERPSDFQHFENQLKGMVTWLQSLDPLPERLVTKPSHSGSKLHFMLWPVSNLRSSAHNFVSAVRRLFVKSQKPFILVQPYLQGLADLEYRLYFVNQQFVSCVSTKWGTTSQGKAAIKRTNVDNPALLAKMRPIAQRAVDLLPADSMLYRVDMFLHEGEFSINEIEMVDGDLMPEYHDDDTDIVKLVGDALVQMGDTVPPRSTLTPSLPVLDTAAVPTGTEEGWRSAVTCMKQALKDLGTESAGLRGEEKAQLQEWTGFLSQMFSGQDLAELCGEIQLPPAPSKRARAMAVGRCLMEEDEQQRRKVLAGEPPSKRRKPASSHAAPAACSGGRAPPKDMARGKKPLVGRHQKKG